MKWMTERVVELEKQVVEHPDFERARLGFTHFSCLLDPVKSKA